MIYCKCECVHAENGECTRDDIVMSLAGCLSLTHTMKCDNNTYKLAISHFGEGAQRDKLVEEMNELADALVGQGNVKEEIADVLNMIEQMKLIYAISNQDVHMVMINKMERTMHKISLQKEGSASGG